MSCKVIAEYLSTSRTPTFQQYPGTSDLRTIELLFDILFICKAVCRVWITITIKEEDLFLESVLLQNSCHIDWLTHVKLVKELVDSSRISREIFRKRCHFECTIWHFVLRPRSCWFGMAGLVGVRLEFTRCLTARYLKLNSWSCQVWIDKDPSIYEY